MHTYIYIYAHIFKMPRQAYQDTFDVTTARRLGNPCRTSWTLPPWSLRANASGAQGVVVFYFGCV